MSQFSWLIEISFVPLYSKFSLMTVRQLCAQCPLSFLLVQYWRLIFQLLARSISLFLRRKKGARRKKNLNDAKWIICEKLYSWGNCINSLIKNQPPVITWGTFQSESASGDDDARSCKFAVQRVYISLLLLLLLLLL